MQNVEELKNKLEIATNLAVVCVSAAVLIVFLWTYVQTNRKPQLSPGLTKGETLTHLQHYEFSNATKTLVIAMNTECSFCAESIPFYNQVSEACRSGNVRTNIAAVFPNTANEVQEYVKRHSLRMDVVPAIDLNGLKVSATPTLILVDSTGKVLDFWVGKLSEENQREVMKRISSCRLEVGNGL